MAVYVNEKGTLKNSTNYATSSGFTQIECGKATSSLNTYNSVSFSFNPVFVMVFAMHSSTTGSSNFSIGTWSSTSGTSTQGSGSTSSYNSSWINSISVSGKTVSVTGTNGIPMLIVGMA